MKALVVDNSRFYCQIVRTMLEELGVDVDTIDDRAQALRLATDTRFDLICVSMHIKGGTGIEFASSYRANERGVYTPILLLSSDGDNVDDPALITAGISRCFAKDDLEKLSEQLAFFVELQRGRSLGGRRVLYVEDSAATALTTKRQFEIMQLEVEHFTTGSEALKRFHSDVVFDVVVVDVLLADQMDGIELVRLIRHYEFAHAEALPVAILAVTGLNKIESRIELFQSGVDDYVGKPLVFEELLARLSLLMARRSLLERIHAQEMELRRLATTDSLTGLSNRRLLMDQAPALLAECTRRNRPLSVLIIDLDHFKRINDEHGHDAGDGILTKVGELIRLSCRRRDIAARVGGEEFICVLANCDDAAALRRADKLRTAIEELRATFPVSASIGFDTTHGEIDFKDLLKRADLSLYEAKKRGRNRTVGYTGIQSVA